MGGVRQSHVWLGKAELPHLAIQGSRSLCGSPGNPQYGSGLAFGHRLAQFQHPLSELDDLRRHEQIDCKSAFEWAAEYVSDSGVWQ